MDLVQPPCTTSSVEGFFARDKKGWITDRMVRKFDRLNSRDRIVLIYDINKYVSYILVDYLNIREYDLKLCSNLNPEVAINVASCF